MTWWNEQNQGAFVGATVSNGRLKTGDLMPERSIARTVIESGCFGMLPAVGNCSRLEVRVLREPSGIHLVAGGKAWSTVLRSL
jgi:hypothetical protein